MAKIIKISCEGSATAREDHSNPMIFRYLPDKSNLWKNCEFYWNDVSIIEADYWVIIGDVDLDEEKCLVDPENIIFMTGEPESIKRYDDSIDFISQFGRVYSSQKDLKHKKLFACRPPINWWVDEGNPIKTQEEFNKISKNSLGYNDFKQKTDFEKNKLISVFCSNKVFTAGHKMRYKFCQKLKKHFGDQLDWFGAGVNPLESKWQGMAPYKYHISLENSASDNYITEKLLDPYMTMTYPIYYGAKNIGEYFSSKQLTTIDIRYPCTAIAKIQKLIEQNIHENSLNDLIEARNLVMDKYNLFNKICEIVNSDRKVDNKQLVTIKKEKFFLQENSSSQNSKRRNFIARFARSILKKIVIINNVLIDYLLLIKFKINV